jgi:starch synthase
MAKSLNILFVASEAFPFAKETGVGDVAAAFPLAMRELKHDIRVMLPKYGCISGRKNKIHDINRLKDIPIQIGNGKTEPLTTKSASLANTRHKVQIYVATNDKYFESRKGIYHDPVKWTEYSDNLERFIFFCRSVLETCVMLGWYPDIIHCNDWQTALIPAYIKYFHPNKFKKTRTVLTIHNAASQGEFPISNFKLLGLPDEAKDAFTHKRSLNILKGGMIYANHITTVSESYMLQLTKDKELTNGLNAWVKQNIDKVKGIRNGIDTTIWDPRTDDSIPQKYENSFSTYKTRNKIALCGACGLQYKKDVPIIGMITRISEPKGTDIIIDAIKDLMKLDIQLVILGQGDAKMKEQLLKEQQKYSSKMSVVFAFAESLAHLVEAGSDMFLMPSRQEGCGLNMLYSLAYGTVPVVHLTGGLKDTAIPFNKKVDDTTNSFAIKDLSPSGVIGAIEQALVVFKDAKSWKKIVANGMNEDYSWNESVIKYYEIYRKILKDE